MRNCFFEDDNFYTNVKPLSFIQEDRDGYFIEVRINQSDVVKFMKIGVTPTYVKDNDIFKIAIGLNNRTTIHVNGIRATELSDKRLQRIPISAVSIVELALKTYSLKTYYRNRDCYATKAIFKVKLPDLKGNIVQ